jgi:transcriptional regulator with XRE-family HTH domain
MAIDPIDRHVGARLRALRRQLRLSQTQLAEALGVTFQQVQKYENGTNRVSASMMVRAARRLDVTPGYFFEGVDALPTDSGPASPFLAMAGERTGLSLAEIWPELTSEAKQVLLQLAEALRGPPKAAEPQQADFVGVRPRGRPRRQQA